jgi:hypothetical protein
MLLVEWQLFAAFDLLYITRLLRDQSDDIHYGGSRCFIFVFTLTLRIKVRKVITQIENGVCFLLF